MSAYVGSRFGQDRPSRIATSSSLLLEATEMPPEPLYQPLIPFLPPSVISGGSVGPGGVTVGGITAGTTDNEDWKEYPDRLDLHVYQGDDVVIPLYFVNAADPTLDMSTPDWTWKAQARIYHRYYAQSTHDFIATTELIAPAPEDEVQVNQTLVSLFLPRYRNRYTGVYSWDLQSVSPYTGPAMPPEATGLPAVPDEEWPPIDQVKTWVYGYLYIVPRVTTTDWLPIPGSVPTGQAVIVTPTGVYGPNGRVP